MIEHLRTSGEEKIHLTMKINFTSLKDSDEKHLMHSRNVLMHSSIIEIISDFDTEEIRGKP